MDNFWYRWPWWNVERVDITPVGWFGAHFALGDITRGYPERISRVVVAGLPGLEWSEGCYRHTYCTDILIVSNGEMVWQVSAEGPLAVVTRFLDSFRPLASS